jgi:hypothetical protein
LASLRTVLEPLGRAGYLAVSIGLGLGLAACKAGPHDEPSADASTAASTGSTASASSVELSDPPAPPDPTDPDERAARILVDQGAYGWTDPGLVKRFTETATMQRLDADCRAKRAAACAVAAWGYNDRGLYRIARERGTDACKLGSQTGCAYLMFAATLIGLDQGVFDYGAKPGESTSEVILRRNLEICDAGIGAGCYLAARHEDSLAGKLTGDEKTFALKMRSCALGCVEGCRDAAQELRVGSQKAAPNRQSEMTRLGALIERTCQRRAGSCAELAVFFDEAHRLPNSLGSDRARRRRMLTWGCSHKDDPTFLGRACQDLDAMGAP